MNQADRKVSSGHSDRYDILLRRVGFRRCKDKVRLAFFRFGKIRLQIILIKPCGIYKCDIFSAGTENTGIKSRRNSSAAALDNIAEQPELLYKAQGFKHGAVV